MDLGMVNMVGLMSNKQRVTYLSLKPCRVCFVCFELLAQDMESALRDILSGI